MKFDIVTIFPEMFCAMDYGIIGRAKKNKLISIKCWNPRNYTSNKYHKIDDKVYGGGPGMVMKVEPLYNTIIAALEHYNYQPQIIYLTPQGILLNHNLVKKLALKNNLLIISGRYEGIDERLLKIKPGMEISIGDYIISGGELSSMVLIDAITRQIPGVVGKYQSVEEESFSYGLLDVPHYTKPRIFNNLNVPYVLLNGNHKEIIRFKRKVALGRTWLRRPEMLSKIKLTVMDRMLLNEFIEETSSLNRNKVYAKNN